jgi:hypothetical protein
MNVRQTSFKGTINIETPNSSSIMPISGGIHIRWASGFFDLPKSIRHISMVSARL